MVRQMTGWTGISSFSGVFATMSTGHGTDSPPQAELSGEKSESPSVLARLGLFKPQIYHISIILHYPLLAKFQIPYF